MDITMKFISKKYLDKNFLGDSDEYKRGLLSVHSRIT